VKGELIVYRCEDCSFDTITIQVDAGNLQDSIACRRGGSIVDCNGTAHRIEPPDPACFLEEPEWEWFAPIKPNLPSTENRIVEQAYAWAPLQLRKRRTDSAGITEAAS
jgi:hypothetical protein